MAISQVHPAGSNESSSEKRLWVNLEICCHPGKFQGALGWVESAVKITVKELCMVWVGIEVSMRIEGTTYQEKGVWSQRNLGISR